MPKFRKKPVVIEAIKWTGENLDEIREFAAPQELWIRTDFPKFKETLVIPTLEGEMDAKKGDYIIKGIKGEIYPCKPDVFEASYDCMPSESCKEDKKVDCHLCNGIGTITTISGNYGSGISACYYCKGEGKV